MEKAPSLSVKVSSTGTTRLELSVPAWRGIRTVGNRLVEGDADDQPVESGVAHF